MKILVLIIALVSIFSSVGFAQEDVPQTKEAQALRYKKAYTTFVEKFRKGQAMDYGYDYIVAGMFKKEGPHGEEMVFALEKMLTQSDKDKIVAEVLGATKLTQPEAEQLAAVYKAARTLELSIRRGGQTEPLEMHEARKIEQDPATQKQIAALYSEIKRKAAAVEAKFKSKGAK